MKKNWHERAQGQNTNITQTKKIQNQTNTKPLSCRTHRVHNVIFFFLNKTNMKTKTETEAGA